MEMVAKAEAMLHGVTTRFYTFGLRSLFFFNPHIPEKNKNLGPYSSAAGPSSRRVVETLRRIFFFFFFTRELLPFPLLFSLCHVSCVWRKSYG
jgi:hypothetical protein